MNIFLKLSYLLTFFRKCKESLKQTASAKDFKSFAYLLIDFTYKVCYNRLENFDVK